MTHKVSAALWCCSDLHWLVTWRCKLSSASLMLASFCLFSFYRMLSLLLCELLVVSMLSVTHVNHCTLCMCGLFTEVPHALMGDFGRSSFNMWGYIFENCTVGEVLYNRSFFLHKSELKYLRVCLLMVPVEESVCNLSLASVYWILGH